MSMFLSHVTSAHSSSFQEKEERKKRKRETFLRASKPTTSTASRHHRNASVCTTDIYSRYRNGYHVLMSLQHAACNNNQPAADLHVHNEARHALCTSRLFSQKETAPARPCWYDKHGDT